MTALEKLVDWMEKQKVERAVFLADQQAVFYQKEKSILGAVWPMNKLHNFAWEMLPKDLRPKLAEKTTLSIFHQSESNLYKITLRRDVSTLRVEVEYQVCWFCQKRAASKDTILHHKMLWRQQIGHIIYWNRKTLEIPRCSYCNLWHGIEILLASSGLAVVICLFFANYSWFSDKLGPNVSVFLGLPILCIVAWQVPRLIISCLGILLGFVAKSKLKHNPDYQAAHREGFGNVLY